MGSFWGKDIGGKIQPMAWYQSSKKWTFLKIILKQENWWKYDISDLRMRIFSKFSQKKLDIQRCKQQKNCFQKIS